MHRWLPLLLLVAGLASAAPLPFHFTESVDWPQFRGPARDNVSPERRLLKAWPAGGPKLLWKGDGVGAGYSSVSVWRDRVFTAGDRDGQAFVFALDRATGKQAWSAKIGKAGGSTYPGSRSTPATDGRLVFALGQLGEVVALDFRTGAEKWRRDMVKDFGGRPGSFGYAESPLIEGAHLVVTPGGPKAAMAALDKATGKEIWTCPVNAVAAYSSAVVSKAGVRHYVQMTDAGAIGVSAKDGSLLWQNTRLAKGGGAAAPTVVPGGVFVTAGVNKGGALLTLTGGPGGVVAAREEYYKPELKNRYGGVTVVGAHVYGDTDDKGLPFCAEWKTGAVAWQRGPVVGDGRSGVCLTAADGHLYLLYENGVVALVPATPKGYAESSTFKIAGASQCRAAPVVVGGRLYLRAGDAVYCHDVTAK